VRKHWRWAEIGSLALAVLVVAGVVGGYVVTKLDEHAALAAVRGYVDAIARGDASAANATVDPARFGSGVDPALLTDELLGSAKDHITVEDLHLGPDADLSADIVDVLVDYRLGKVPATASLRVRRADTTAGVLHDWRVIDPLLVPVLIETNEPSTATATLGTAAVPVSGPDATGWPQRRFFVYPAVYELHGHDSRYLTATRHLVVATTYGRYERPANTDGQPVHLLLYYRATPELADAVNQKVRSHVTACFAAVPKVPRDCPADLADYSDYVTGIRLERQPRVVSIVSFQVEYRGVRATVPSLNFFAENGAFSYTAEGGRGQATFDISGGIVVSPDDELTVTFTG
jgi:hypothetical protein